MKSRILILEGQGTLNNQYFTGSKEHTFVYCYFWFITHDTIYILIHVTSGDSRVQKLIPSTVHVQQAFMIFNIFQRHSLAIFIQIIQNFPSILTDNSTEFMLFEDD